MMPNHNSWQRKKERLAGLLRRGRRPIAVTFLDTVPQNIEPFSGFVPSGCSFWRIAGEGRAFYTVPSDHFNCAVGSYTLNMPLTPERQQETGQTL